MSLKKIVFHAVLFVVSTGVFLQQMAIRSRAQETRSNEQIIRISASTFEFRPSEITLSKGVPVILELISQDRHHGFKVAEFHLRADIQREGQTAHGNRDMCVEQSLTIQRTRPL